jgi:transposase InsO family protein
VADLTYVAIAVGFVYVALVMDAWSRRVVGWAICRRIETRLTLAALHAAIGARHLPPGCIDHSDADRNMPRGPIATGSWPRAWSGRWGGAETLTTMRWPRAS